MSRHEETGAALHCGDGQLFQEEPVKESKGAKWNGGRVGLFPDLLGMSLSEVGLAFKPHLLASRSEPAASVVNFVLRHSGLERGGGYRKTILAFPLSFYPTAAEISLSLEAGRAQLGQAEGAEASLDEYTQEAGLEAAHSSSPALRISKISADTANAQSALKPFRFQALSAVFCHGDFDC